MLLPTASRGSLIAAGAALAGGVSAALFAVATLHAGTILIFLAYGAALPLFVAGLGLGNLASLGASVVGMGGLYTLLSPSYAATYAVLNGAPALLLTFLALRHRFGNDQKVYWYPEGFLMTALALYPCIIFLGASIQTWGQDSGLLAMTIDALNTTVESVRPQLEADAAVKLSSMIEPIAKLLPSITGCAWMIITMVSMILGQHFLTQTKQNIRSDFSLYALHIPTWMIFLVAGTGLIGSFAPAPYDYIGLNLSIMLGTPFLFVGLAVIHAWARTTKSPRTTLTIFYVLASILVWSTLIVAALGVIDQWVNFRQRLAIRPNTHLS